MREDSVVLSRQTKTTGRRPDVANDSRVPTEEIEKGMSGAGRVMKAAGQQSKVTVPLRRGLLLRAIGTQLDLDARAEPGALAQRTR